mgnify:CR=1 FL=1
MIGLLFLSQALAFDHTHARFGEFLDGAVGERRVDYEALAKRSDTLDAYLAEVAAVDASGFTDDQQLALYVNAYNAYTLRLILDERPLKSIFDLDANKVWDTRKYRVAGGELTLNQMEHEHVRKLGDGRIHAVLNCAAKGCPPLRPNPFVATDTDGQLTAGARGWAATNAYRLEASTLHLSQLFDWYAGDFAHDNQGDLAGLDDKGENAVWFLAKFLPADEAKRLQKGDLTVAWTPYDWALNGDD